MRMLLRCNLTCLLTVLLTFALYFGVFIVTTLGNVYDEWVTLGEDKETNEIRAAIEQCNQGTGYVRLGESEAQVKHSLLDMKPPKFLSRFNNPCWIECLPRDLRGVYPRGNSIMSDLRFIDKFTEIQSNIESSGRRWRLRCLPKFYLIGMPKCGTTDIFARLLSHPDITKSGAKEMDWWSSKTDIENDVFNLERYLDMSDLAADEILRNVRLEDSGNITYPIIFGDGSPNTMFSNSQWKKYKGDGNSTDNMLLTPKFMHHIQPDAKLIVMLRDPAYMTFSTYKYFHHHVGDMSVEHFHGCVMLSIKEMMKCEEEYSRTYCTLISYHTFNFFKEHRQCAFVLRSLQLGRYYVFLEKWLKYYNVDNFFIVRISDYTRNQGAVVNDLWKWLGVREFPRRDLFFLRSDKAMNSGSRDIGSMLPETEKLLRKYFHDSNLELSLLLNDRTFTFAKNIQTLDSINQDSNL